MDHVERIKSAKIKHPASFGNDEVHKKKWAIISLASIPLVMTLGNSMLIPVLPTMEKELNISSFQSSLIITVYSVVAIFLIPVAGYLSDKWGRKKIIIPSLIIAGIGGIISGISAWTMDDPYWIILIGRTFQGVGAAGASPIVLPLVGDMFKKEKDISSTLGMIETSNTAGKVLSPVLGAGLASFLWFSPFLAFPVFCAVSIMLVLFLVRAPKKQQVKVSLPDFFKKIKQTFHDNGKWLFVIFLIGGILMLVLFGELFYLSNVFEDVYKIKDFQKGLYLAIPLGALCLASFITGKWIKEDKILMKWLMFAGVISLGITVFLVLFSTKLWYLLLLFTIGGVGIGVSLPSLDAMITEGIEKDQRGSVTSLYSSMRFVGVAVGPPIAAASMTNYKPWLFIGLAVLCLICSILTFWAIHPENEDGKTEPTS